MTTTTKGKGLHAKLAEVMAEAERIPKNGTAPPQMGSFKFVQSGDAADFIRKALGSRGVSMLPSAVEVVERRDYETKSKAIMTEITVRQTWTLTDGDTGETATIQSIGSGADTGDKAAPKAMTSAMKYAHLTGFMLSTGDDAEQHDTSDRQARETPQVGSENVTLIGIDTLTGDVKKGTSDRYLCDWREAPNGWVIGFAMKRAGDGENFPQVGVMGTLADGLRALHPDGTSLVGQHLKVKGRFYAVRTVLEDGKLGRAYTRVIVGQGADDFIETDDVRIPARPDPEQDAVDAVPVAPGQESFDLAESARIDAEAARA